MRRSRTYWIRFWKDELQSVDLVLVEGVLVEDFDVKKPLSEIVAIYQLDARRQAMVGDLQLREVSPV